MKITFEIQESELNKIVQDEIKKEVVKFFNSNKESFIKQSVEQNTKSLKNDGFFNRSISSSLTKAIYDKVNREFSVLIESKVEREVDKAIKQKTINDSIDKLVDRKVKEKISLLLGKV